MIVVTVKNKVFTTIYSIESLNEMLSGRAQRIADAWKSEVRVTDLTKLHEFPDFGLLGLYEPTIGRMDHAHD